ncbi:MAG: aminoglycoside phosphotransferase family protein [Symploca sp. SIO2G7]|nr:aminoglycoside phosphotransferase family protein [Symploca sp. SIO2G7]
MENLAAIANQFQPQSKVINIQEYGNGNINNTFLITLATEGEKHFILQRLNTQVFLQPELVMGNMRTITEHIHHRLHHASLSGERLWKMPRVLPTQDAQDYWIEPNGAFWRAISFIDAAQSFDTIQNTKHAREIGYGLGMFHNLINDLPTEKLADTLEGFHITPGYLRHYQQVLTTVNPTTSPEVEYCLQFVSDRSSWANVLENAKEQGRLPLRPIHGDPKINNIMIDSATGQAISIIDLDTVKPGLVHYDIGDCLRSGCNLLGEETQQWEAVCFEPDLCQMILQGYLTVARDFLTTTDYNYLYDAIRLIAFELGLRFFTDYLQGNVYFKVKEESQNLARALVQFKLTESIESQEVALRTMIKDLQ